MATLMKVRSVREWEIEGAGKKIYAARLADGRTVQALAEAAGISRNYWYELERESIRGAVNVETLRKVGEVLGVKLLED